MRSTHVILLVFSLLSFVHAWNWIGGASSWWAYWLSNGEKLMAEAYKACTEYKSGAQGASGATCMYDVGKFVLYSTISAVLGGIVVDAVKPSGNTEEKKDHPPNRVMARWESDEAMRDLVLERFNGELIDGLLATHIVPSHIHPDDGFAFRMNVHSDDNSTLHIHTNGTSAMAVFDEDPTLQEREILPTDGNHFKFGSISGIFFQAHLINKPPGDWKSEMNTFMNRFAISNFQPAPIMSTHDKWKIQMCNKQNTATFWYGKLEAKENGFQKTYELITPSGCK